MRGNVVESVELELRHVQSDSLKVGEARGEGEDDGRALLLVPGDVAAVGVGRSVGHNRVSA